MYCDRISFFIINKFYDKLKICLFQEKEFGAADDSYQNDSCKVYSGNKNDDS